MSKERVLAIAIRTLTVLAAVVGLFCTWWTTTRPPLGPLPFFTVQTNLMLAAYFGYRLYASWRGGELDAKAQRTAPLKGAVTLYIVITAIINHIMLVKGENPIGTLFDGEGNDVSDLSGFLLHYVTPVTVVADWLLVDRKRQVRWRWAFIWLLFPIAYLIFALVRGPITTAPLKYPYPFLDVNEHGYPGVFGNVLTLFPSFIVMGLAVVGLQRLVRPGGPKLNPADAA